MFAVCVLFAVACEAASASAATVSGTVKTPDATPVADVDLDFLTAGTTNQVVAATTDAGGQYATTVPLATYDVLVTPPPGSGFLPQTVPDVVVAGDTILDVVLVSAGAFTYDGTLVDRDGTPVGGQSIALRQGGVDLGVDVTASVGGAFAVDVAPGSYELRIQGGFAFPPSPLVPAGFVLTRNTSVDLTADKTETISLETRRIEGTVVDPDGVPVAGAQVLQFITSTGFGDFFGTVFSQGAQTDTQGRFTLVVFPGTYSVQATPGAGSGLAAAIESVVVSGTDVTPVIVLPRPVTYDGTLVDRNGAPVGGQSIALRQGGVDLGFDVTASVDGAFSVDVAPGTYQLRVHGNSTFPLNPLVPQTFVLTRNSALNLTADATETITLETRRIEGTVVDPNGLPVAGADVTQFIATTSFGDFFGTVFSQITQTDAHGRFTFVVFPGTYSVRASPVAGSGLAAVIESVAVAGTDATPVIVLPHPVTYDGALVDRDGMPVGGQSIILRQGGVDLGVDVTASVGGAFTVDVAPGSYELRVHGNSTFPPNPLVPQTFTLARNTSLDLTANATETITLETRRIDGTVVDPDGLPVAGAQVVQFIAVANFGDFFGTVFSQGTQTDAQGRFTFVVFPGFYQLQVTPPAGSGLTSFVIQNVQVTSDLQLAVLLQFVGESTNQVLPPGGTATTDTEADGATPSDPVETTLTLPAGIGGAVTIVETPITTIPPSGFQFLTQQVNVTAPSGTVANPLVLIFRIDASRVVGSAGRVRVFKDGVLVPACTGAAGVADPDPCMASRIVLPDGDVEITVLTSSASAWNLGIDVPATTTTTTTTPATSSSTVTSTVTTSSSTSSSTTSTSTTSSTSTSVAASSTTTTSVTTSTLLPTTTTLPGSCGDEPTLEAVACRIATLEALIGETPGIDPARNRLLAAVTRAGDQVDLAALRLDAGDTAKAAQALKRALKRMRAMQHVLRSLRTRQLVPNAVRLAVLAEVADVTERVRAVHAAVRALSPGSLGH